MDENPYQSPEFEPEVDEPSPKRPAKPPNRYVWAALCGFMAFGGLVMSQGVIVETHWAATVPSLAEKRAMLPIYALIAVPAGILMGWWAFRAPQSNWMFVVACLLGVSGFVLGIIGIMFFGLT